jgi:Uma2 family endonuclease
LHIINENDDWREARQKMEEYIDNGVQSGWLINRAEQLVLIFRADGTVARLQGFQQKLNGETVLKGFEFDLGLLLY